MVVLSEYFPLFILIFINNNWPDHLDLFDAAMALPPFRKAPVSLKALKVQSEKHFHMFFKEISNKFSIFIDFNDSLLTGYIVILLNK